MRRESVNEVRGDCVYVTGGAVLPLSRGYKDRVSQTHFWEQYRLSWITVLRKREGYRQAFCGFDPEKVALMTDEDVERLMENPDIIRNRRKILAAINNARQFLSVQKEFGSFLEYIWSFFPERKPVTGHYRSLDEIPATSPESVAISKDMKRRGFSFFGPTCCYSFLQATGFVNDHLEGCIYRL